MKKIIFIGGLAVIVLAIVMFSTISGNKQDKVLDAKEFTVAALNPEVSVKESDVAILQPVLTQAEVAAGATVQTGLAGRAAILYPNQTITNLGPETMVKLEAVSESGNQSRLSLALGSVWAKVESITGTGAYQIDAQNLVASVRGTILAVEELKARGPGIPAQTHLLVLEGAVSVWPRDRQTGQVDRTAELEVVAGEWVSAAYDFVQGKVLIDKTPIPMTVIDLERPIIETNLTAEMLARPEVKKILQIIRARGRPRPEAVKSTSPKESSLEAQVIDSNVFPVQPAVIGELVFNVERIDPEVIVFTRSAPPGSTSAAGTANPEKSRTIASAGDGFSVTSSGRPPEQSELKIVGSGFQDVQTVLIGDREVAFLVKDTNTIMVFVLPEFQPGQFDVSVVKKEKKTLFDGLEIRYE